MFNNLFRRFGKGARVAVVLAQKKARDTHASVIDVEHLALGVLEAEGEALAALDAAGLDVTAIRARLIDLVRGEGLDDEALAAVGIDLDEVSRAADETFGAGALERAGALIRMRGRDRRHLPFTSAAKKTLELALRESVRLDQATISDRHVLLAVLREGGPAATALAEVAELGVLRAGLERLPDAA